MDIFDVAIAAAKYIGTPAVIGGSLAWLLKASLQEALRRESDRLRSGIERDSALAIERVRQEAQTELEKVRHQLSVDLEGYKVRFARLHERRVDPLVSLFASVAGICSKVNVAKAVLELESDDEWTERLEALRVDTVAALNKYHAARLYLPGPTAQRIQSLIVSIRRGLLRYKVQVGQLPPTTSRDAFKEILSQDFSREAEELAMEIRSLLGVEDAAPLMERLRAEHDA